MTDQIPADKVRPILDEWERIKEYADWEDMDNLVRDVRALLPTPPRPTLADMTMPERDACRLMQADVEERESRAVIINPHWECASARVLWPGGIIEQIGWGRVTPRPDLPRMEWPGTEKPAPALPDGWRFADHQTRGRVIVTRPEPDNDGEVIIICPLPDRVTRAGIFWCKNDKLTYIDTDQ